MNSPQVDPMDAFDLEKELQYEFTMFRSSNNNNSSTNNSTNIITNNGDDNMKSMRGSVLLTGCCGFLGLQLLHDLLVENKTVYCLLRPNKDINGLDRIKERFQFCEISVERRI